MRVGLEATSTVTRTQHDSVDSLEPMMNNRILNRIFFRSQSDSRSIAEYIENLL